eukprot:scaffold169211_cov14-Tisochrysis_lutea.AAC.1
MPEPPLAGCKGSGASSHEVIEIYGINQNHLRIIWKATWSMRSPIGRLCSDDTALAADSGSAKLTNPHPLLLPASSWSTCACT